MRRGWGGRGGHPPCSSSCCRRARPTAWWSRPPCLPPPLLPLQFLLQQACKGNSLVVTAPVLPGSPPLLGLYLAFDTILPAELLKSIGLEVDHMLQVSKP